MAAVVDDDEGNQEVPVESIVSLVSNTCISLPIRRANNVASNPLLDPNWQANYRSVRERNAIMFNNELMADVHFKVGSFPGVQRIPGHKYVLASGSSVFFAMFYGGLADTKTDIEIPDVEPCAFLNLLK